GNRQRSGLSPSGSSRSFVIPVTLGVLARNREERLGARSNRRKPCALCGKRVEGHGECSNRPLASRHPKTLISNPLLPRARPNSALMLPRRCANSLFMLAGLLFPISLGRRHLFAPPAVYAQPDSSGSRLHPAPRLLAPAAAGAPADRELFRQHCVKCHGADGAGGPGRRRQLEVPDFTDAAWQARRSEAQLLASMLDGKGDERPA